MIFGASGYGLDLLYSLDDIEFQMLCFIDNNKDIQGNKYYGYHVDSPENINK